MSKFNLFYFIFRNEREDEKRNASNSSKRRRSRERDHEKKQDDNSHADEIFDAGVLDKEEEQKRLELEMQKRRERIERWRAERKKKEQEVTRREARQGTLVAGLTIPSGTVKKWSLEDDDDEEDEEAGKEGEGKVEEEDPLDAFMQGKLFLIHTIHEFIIINCFLYSRCAC